MNGGAIRISESIRLAPDRLGLITSAVRAELRRLRLDPHRH